MRIPHNPQNLPPSYLPVGYRFMFQDEVINPQTESIHDRGGRCMTRAKQRFTGILAYQLHTPQHGMGQIRGWMSCGFTANNPLWTYAVPLDWVDPAEEVKPTYLAAGYNPLDLTEDQVAVKNGWRLLTRTEHALHRYLPMCEWWDSKEQKWMDSPLCLTNSEPLRTFFAPEFFRELFSPAPGVNPDALTRFQVETHEGWRLLTEDELCGETLEYNETSVYHVVPGIWSRLLTHSLKAGVKLTVRTQKPPRYFRKMVEEATKPKKKVRVPLTPDDFPPGTVVTSGSGSPFWAQVTRVFPGPSEGFVAFERIYTFKEVAEPRYEHWRYSTDGTKTWKPCFTEKEAL